MPAPEEEKMKMTMRHWVTLASAIAVAGCAGPLAANGGLFAANGHPLPSYAVQENGHLVCKLCGAELNPDGTHRLSTMLVRELQYLQAHPNAKSTKGQMTIHAFTDLALTRLGMSNYLATGGRANPLAKLNFNDPTQVEGALKIDSAYHIMDGCCVPPGTPISDPPY